MKQFNWEEFLDNKIAVHCKTEEKQMISASRCMNMD